MILFNPKEHNIKYGDDKTRDMMQKVIDHFEEKGLESIKKDWHEKTWNYEFVEFMKENQVMATLMTPAGYGAEDSRWDTHRNVMFAEITAFYGITYWYTFQVSMLGLCPVWMGSNEEVKQKTAKLLQDGGVFAFGLSEKEHGADIYSSDMMLYPQDDGAYKANGDKYYIGNGNEAALVSTFAKMNDSGEYVFFAVDSKHEKYECVKNTVSHQNYVAEYRLHDYPITKSDIMEEGPDAWDNMLNTINVCKFNLGWGSIGLATHAFYESISHAAGRNLYGKYVTDFPHVKRIFVESYSRIVAMKVFAERAVDYMRSANENDRRYLLFNPMVKMKVTREGEKAVQDLWDVIAAKGFEAEPFFEVAVNELPMLPKLEGTVHVNIALIVKFMNNFLFNPGEFPEIGKMHQTENDDFLFNQGPTRGLGKIQFHDYSKAYDSMDTPNVSIFKEQILGFKEFLTKATPDKYQSKDIDYLLSIGDIFCLIPYGQLILENKEHMGVSDDLIESIFNFLVSDFSKFATELMMKPSNSDKQRELAKDILRSPNPDAELFGRVWGEVYEYKDAYKMRDQDF